MIRATPWIGTEMYDFSNAVDIEALPDYRLAVGRRTRVIAGGS